MNTNSKVIREKMRSHILERVFNFDGEPFKKFEDAKKHVQNEFNRVANHPYNLRMFPNKQKRFSDYLCGLPFNFEYSYYDIAQFLNGLGINPKNKQFDGEKSMKQYHYMIFKEIFS